MRRVYVVEDDSDFAALVEEVLSSIPEVGLVETFSSAGSFLASIPVDDEAAHQWTPELLLIDIYAFGDQLSSGAQPGLDGLTVATYLCQFHPSLNVLVISSVDPGAMLREMNREGVGRWSYLKKSPLLSVSDVKRAIQMSLDAVR